MQNVPFTFRVLMIWVMAILFLASKGEVARAEGLSGYLEWIYNDLTTTTEDSTGRKTETDATNFLQRYSLNLDRRIYPNLTLYASGLFERNAVETTIDGAETDTTLRRLRPRIELNLKTPLYIAQVSYYRNEEKTEIPGTQSQTVVQENYTSALQWIPDGFPHLTFQYFRTNNYDRRRESLDTTDDLFQGIAEYRPVESLYLRYQGSFQETDDNLQNSEVRQTINNVKAIYSDSWWDGLLTIYSDYEANRREFKVDTGSASEITLPVFPLQGLSAIDDTPEEGSLDPNPALIDGNFVASAGINLGVPPPGSDDRPRNIGLRFDDGTEVNRLLVSVDQELPQVIAGTFLWQVYTSDDNRNWEPAGGQSPAVFDTFQKHFEIAFTNVVKRYVKVVVNPLSPAVPSASQFPSIQVTEMRAEIVRSAEEVTEKQVSTVQRYNLDLRARLLKVPALFYEFFYFVTKPDPGSSNWTLSNGLSATHRFNRMLTSAARFAREDGVTAEEDRLAYIYTASLTVTPLDTLRHTLVFSGLDETVGDVNQKNYGLFLQNNAHLYEGVDVVLGGGASSQSFSTGEESFSTQVNSLITLVPNRKVTVNLIYAGSTTERSGGVLEEEETDYTRRGEVTLTITPVSTLYLFGSRAVVWQSNQEKRTIQRYSATFSPFPDGTLQFNFFYDEELQSQFNQKQRIITPSLRWNITPRMSLDLSYSAISDDSDVSSTDTHVFSSDLLVSF